MRGSTRTPARSSRAASSGSRTRRASARRRSAGVANTVVCPGGCSRFSAEFFWVCNVARRWSSAGSVRARRRMSLAASTRNQYVAESSPSEKSFA